MRRGPIEMTMRLRTLLGDHPGTAALKNGSLKSDLVTFDFAAMTLYAVLSARGIGREPRPVGQVQICVGPAAAQHIGRAPDPAG